MDELPPDARQFLAGLQNAHDPPAGMNDRVWRAAGLDMPGAPMMAAERARQVWWKSASTSVVGKTAAVALVVGVGLGAWLYPRDSAPKPRPAPIAAAPVTGTEPDRSAEPTEAAPTAVGQAIPPPEPHPPKRSRRTGDGLIEEIASLRSAADALAAGRPAQALALLQDHQRRFATAKLSEEREGLIAIARCTLDLPNAAQRARRHLQHYPHGILRDRVVRTCKLEGSPP